MKFPSILAVASALAASAQGAPWSHAPFGSGKVSSEIDAQIVGGRNAESGEFPHQASIQARYINAWLIVSEPQHFCGGTLIAPNWVLTAAHCITGLPWYTLALEVLLGTNTLKNNDGQRHSVSNIIVHTQYNRNGNVGPYDIGMLKMATSAVLNDHVKLASLPTPGVYPTGDAITSGWGSTSKKSKSPVYPNDLQTVTMPVIDFQTCYNYVSDVYPSGSNPLDEASNLCVGDLKKATQSACSGDSGGPLIQRMNDNAVVVGIVSWGLADCASEPFPSVFTRVSAFVDWIADMQKAYA